MQVPTDGINVSRVTAIIWCVVRNVISWGHEFLCEDDTEGYLLEKNDGGSRDHQASAKYRQTDPSDRMGRIEDLACLPAH